MANAIYPKWKGGVMQGSANTNLSTGTVKAALVDTGTYTYSAAHQFYSDLTGVVGTPVEITGKTFTDDVFDGADVTFTSVTGATAEAIVLYVDSGVTTTSTLVAFFDTGVTGLPVTPNGGNITVTWNASGIFKL